MILTNITSLVLYFDKILLIIALALAGGAIIYALVKELKARQSQRHLERIHLRVPAGVWRADEADIERIEAAAHFSYDKWDRIEAIVKLGLLPNHHSLEILEEALYAKDTDVSYYALRALGQKKTVKAARVLLSYLESHSAAGRNIAMMLSAFPVEEIVEELFITVDNLRPHVRYWVIRTLNELSFLLTAGMISKLLVLSRDNNPNVRAVACALLSRGTFRHGVMEALVVRLEDKEWFVRLHAVRALYVILGGDCLPLVAKLLADSAWQVQDAVKDIMVEHIEASLPYIIKYLDQGDPYTCKAGADALVASGHVVFILKSLLEGPAHLTLQSQQLLSQLLLKCEIYFGLKRAVSHFAIEEQARLIKIIAAINPSIADRLGGGVA